VVTPHYPPTLFIMKNRFIRVKTAAKLLGYTDSYISYMARQGILTRYYVGTRSYLLDRDEVMLYPHQRVV
jgi:excisionase family DNA binding protein